MVSRTSNAADRIVGRGALLAAVAGLALGLVGGQAARAADVSFGGSRIYFDFSSKENKDEGTGTKSSDSGVGADAKRFYASFTYKVDDTWSMNFTSDIGDQGTKRYDVFVKKAYLQGHFSDAFNLRLGSADEAWIPYVEDAYGYRYVENTITDGLGFGNSADWGVHAYGKSGIFSYQVEAVNGHGYSNPSRSKGVDFEGRFSLDPIPGLKLAIGGYSGKRGLETDSAPAKHTASRTDALINYSNPHFRIGGEWFSADNYTTVTSANKDKADGWSAWVTVPINPTFEVFARYDNANPSKTLKPKQDYTYYNAGVQHAFNSTLLGSLVWKHAEVDGGQGTVGTSNGAIGSSVADRKGKYDEIGIFMQLKI